MVVRPLADAKPKVCRPAPIMEPPPVQVDGLETPSAETVGWFDRRGGVEHPCIAAPNLPGSRAAASGCG